MLFNPLKIKLHILFIFLLIIFLVKTAGKKLGAKKFTLLMAIVVSIFVLLTTTVRVNSNVLAPRYRKGDNLICIKIKNKDLQAALLDKKIDVIVRRSFEGADKNTIKPELASIVKVGNKKVILKNRRETYAIDKEDIILLPVLNTGNCL